MCLGNHGVYDSTKSQQPGTQSHWNIGASDDNDTKDAQADTRAQRAKLQRQETLIAAQQDRLLNLRINDQIEEVAFNRKQTELRDRLSEIRRR